MSEHVGLDILPVLLHSYKFVVGLRLTRFLSHQVKQSQLVHTCRCELGISLDIMEDKIVNWVLGGCVRHVFPFLLKLILMCEERLLKVSCIVTRSCLSLSGI